MVLFDKKCNMLLFSNYSSILYLPNHNSITTDSTHYGSFRTFVLFDPPMHAYNNKNDMNHQFSPAYLREIVNYITIVTSHVGRNSHRLFVPRVHNTYGKNNLYYKGTQTWNLLNVSLYATATLGQFKHLYISTTSNCMHVMHC